MVKTDLRRTNNTKANRDLNLELDLWILYEKNGRKPIVIKQAISKGRYDDLMWTIFYSPLDRDKDRPYLLTCEGIGEFDSSRFGTLSSAKYYLKKSSPDAKYIKLANK